MLFAVIGILKQPPLERDARFEADLSEHLSARFMRIAIAGYLRDDQARPVGVMGLVEAQDFPQAKAFLDTSPFTLGGHYDHVHLAAFDIEVGRLS